MGFFRKQEEQMALRLLTWRCQKTGVPLPSETRLAEMASELVTEAHRIAGKRGRNVWGILKELASDLKK